MVKPVKTLALGKPKEEPQEEDEEA